MEPFLFQDQIFLYLTYQSTSTMKPIMTPNREYTYRLVTKKQYFRSSYDCCCSCCWVNVSWDWLSSCNCCCGCCCWGCNCNCLSACRLVNSLSILSSPLLLELLLLRGKELIWTIQLLPSMFNIIAKTENMQINNVEIFK